MSDDSLQARVAAMQARSAIRSAQSSSRLRADAESAGFLDLYRSLQRQFGSGVQILYCDNGKGDRYGTPQPRGVPFSDPPPKPIGRRR